MKKSLLTLMVAGALLQQPLFADEQAKPIDTHSLKTTATGVLIGGILAGPPGLLVGLAGGALVADAEHDSQELAKANEALNQTRRVQAREQDRTARRHQAYKALLNSQASRLEAMQEGFSICIGFRTDSAEIEPRIGGQLSSLALMLKAFPELNLHILARADRRGSDSYNQTLSRVRAEAVAKRLQNAGLPESRITIHYVGEADAAYPVGDIEGLGFDRTVQLTLVRGGAS